MPLPSLLLSLVSLSVPTAFPTAEPEQTVPTHVPHHFSAPLARGILSESSPSLCDPRVTQFSGYFHLSTSRPLAGKNYFYWFFEARSKPATAPLVLWMTGGPGCSSEVALFGENGPCAVNQEGNETVPNPHSWNNEANLLYIDQPAGTGFSYGLGLDHDESEVAEDMYAFLQAFFRAHPEYESNDFFVFGESYAGHYVPAVSHRVWQRNKALAPGVVPINLKGIGIGNGLTEPSIQYRYYKDMAVSTNHHAPAVGKLTHAAMTVITPICILAIKACQAPGSNTTTCLSAIEVCNAGLLIPYTATGCGYRPGPQLHTPF